MPQSGSSSLVIKDKIGTIEFHHPKGNSLPGVLLQKLVKQIKEASKNDEINVIVLKSKGQRAFCAGASFDELATIDNYEQGKQFFSGFASVINTMRKCPKLIITGVQGKAVGGGIGLVAASDYAIAHESASIKLSELSLGIGPFVIAPVVQRKIGFSAFSTLSIDAKNWHSANWALQKGLYSKICKTQDILDEEISALTHQLAGCNPEAMKEFKKMLWADTEHWDTLLKKHAETSGRLILSEDTKHYIENFKSSK